MQPHTPGSSGTVGHPDPSADIDAIASALLGRDVGDSFASPIGPASAVGSLPITIPPDGVGEAEALERLRRVALAAPSASASASSNRFVNQLFAGRERLATVPARPVRVSGSPRRGCPSDR